jgi:hypothetical protein
MILYQEISGSEDFFKDFKNVIGRDPNIPPVNNKLPPGEILVKVFIDAGWPD